MDEHVWHIITGHSNLVYAHCLEPDCVKELNRKEIECRINAIERLKKHPIMRHVMILFPSVANILGGDDGEGTCFLCSEADYRNEVARVARAAKKCEVHGHTQEDYDEYAEALKEVEHLLD